MQYVKLNKDKQIVAVSDFNIPGFVQTSKEVVRNVDGEYVFKDELNIKHEEEVKASLALLKKKNEILSELNDIDAKSVRAARAVSLAVVTGEVPNLEDTNMLIDLEQKAIALRKELKSL